MQAALASKSITERSTEPRIYQLLERGVVEVEIACRQFDVAWR